MEVGIFFTSWVIGTLILVGFKITGRYVWLFFEGDFAESFCW